MIPRVYKVHPFADKFPMMPLNEIEELADDIREHGQREAIVLSFDGTTILDGRNRLAAVQLLGLEPKTRKINSRMSEVDIIELIVSSNIKRRHLTQGQRAMLVIEASEEITRLVGDRANEARAERARHRERGPQGTFVPADPSEPNSTVKGSTPSGVKPAGNRTRPLLAAQAGVSEWSIGTAQRLMDHAPDLAEQVRKGEMGLNTARKEMLETHPELGMPPKEDLEWLPPHGTPPPANARAPKARVARIAWIRYMATDNATSFQIGEKLGIEPIGIRRIAREAGVEIPADRHALRKKQPTFNVDAAMDLLLSDLDILDTTIERICSAATELDPSKVEGYVKALRAHRKTINHQLSSLVKELTNGNSEEV